MVGPRFGHRRRRHGAHGSGAGKLAHDLVGLLPDAIADPLMQKAGIDRLAVLLAAVDVVRRGGTVSISGVYGGARDPLRLFQMFDKQLTLRMGQANVKHWIDDILPLVDDEATRSAPWTWPRTGSPSTVLPRCTRPSRRRATAPSRSSSSPEPARRRPTPSWPTLPAAAPMVVRMHGGSGAEGGW